MDGFTFYSKSKVVDVNATGKLIIRGKSYRDVTALWAALKIRDLPIIKLLLRFGPNIQCRDRYGDTCLMDACKPAEIHTCPISEYELVTYLVDEGNVDINDKNKLNGATALHYAAAGTDENVVKFLIQRGANIRAKDDYGMTPLMVASLRRNCRMVEILLHYYGAEEKIMAYELLIVSFIRIPIVYALYGYTKFVCMTRCEMSFHVKRLSKALREYGSDKNVAEYELLLSETSYKIFTRLTHDYLELSLKRIFGDHHIILGKVLKHKANTLTKKGRLTEGLNVWMDCLEVYKNNTNKRINTKHVIGLFSRMIDESVSIPIEAALKLFQYIVTDVELHYDTFGKGMEQTIVNGTYLVGLLLSLFAKPDESKRDLFRTFANAVKTLVHLNLKKELCCTFVVSTNIVTVTECGQSKHYIFRIVMCAECSYIAGQTSKLLTIHTKRLF